jgi:hypothetical protein
MKKSDESPHNAEALNLELPDWRGMTDCAGRISVETAFELMEQYVELFPEAYRRPEKQPREKCVVEFVL